MKKILFNVIIDIFFQVPLIMTVLGYGNGITKNILKCMPILFIVCIFINLLMVFMLGAIYKYSEIKKDVFDKKSINDMKWLVATRNNKFYKLYNNLTDISMFFLLMLAGKTVTVFLFAFLFITKNMNKTATEVMLEKIECDM